MTTKFPLIQKDTPVTQTASLRTDKTDRRYIDDQILALEQSMIDALLQGYHASWYRAAVTLKPGDVVKTSAAFAADNFQIVTNNFGTARPTGVVVTGANANGLVLVAISGSLPPSITNLAAAAGFVRVSTAGRCEMVSGLASTDYQVGEVDGAGILTISQSGLGGGSLARKPRKTGLSPKYVFNILDYGGNGDSDVNIGSKIGSGGTLPATDNLAAFNAAYAAVQASGAPGEIYFPYGNYFFSGTLVCNGVYPVYITGDTGHRFAAGGGTATQFIFPVYDTLNSGNHVTNQCILFGGTAGSSIQNITIWASPNSQQWVHWKAGLPGATFNTFLIPSYGSIGFVFHATNGNPAIALSTNEPVWGVKLDTGRRYEIGQYFWSAITDVLNPSNKVWQYTFTAATGDQRTWDDQTGYVPYAGACAIATTGSTFTAADVSATVVRPSDAQFNASNGSLFLVSSVTGTSVVLTGDPTTWNTASTLNATVTIAGTGGSVTFKNVGPCLPRTVGLSTVLTNLGATGTLTVTLTSTTGILVDPNNTGGGGGTVNWEVRPVCHGIQCNGSSLIDTVNVIGAPGDAIFINAGQGTAGDLWLVRDCNLSHSARNGISIQGGDANIGEFSGNQILGHGDTGIDDNSFLGCSFYGGQLADEQNGHPGNYSIRVKQTTSGSTYDSVYIEGGYAPAFFRGGEIRGQKGIWNFYPDSGFVGSQSVSDSGGRHTPRAFSAGPKGQPWAVTRNNASRKTYLNDFVLPSAGSSLRMQVTSVSYPGARKAAVTEPTWPTIAGNTVTESSTLVATASTMTGNGVPVVVTTATPHGFDNGDQVTGSGTVGNTAANTTAKIINLSPVTFQLAGVTGNGTWVSGGTFTRTDSITYQAQPTGNSNITIGNDADPAQAYNITWSDCPGGPGNTTAFGLRANTPVTGEMGWTFGGNPGNCPIAAGFVGGIPYARFLYQVRVNDEILGTGGADNTSGTNTTKPDDSTKRWAGTATSATAVTVNTYTPPDGSVVDIVWDFVVKQTAGTGNPKGAKFRVSYSVRRAGSVLTVLDAASITAGSANEITPTIAVDISGAPAINLTFNAADATKTFVLGGIREVLGVPTV
jgi:hypothetical protein